MLHSIINRGIQDEISDDMRRTIRFLNLASLVSISTNLIVGTINTIQHNWLLVISNITLLAFSLTLLFVKKFNHFNTAMYVILALFSVYFFLNAVLFHNSMQYALMMLMAFTIMAADNKTARIILISMQAMLLLTYTYFQNSPALVKPVPIYRHCFIIACILFVFVCLLEYFKSRQLHYRQNLALANEELKASNKTKERMLSILSHDFNTPVRNLSSSLHLLDENVLTQQQFHDVSLKLQAQLQVLTTSLEDVLQWSKLQAGGDKTPPGQININGVVGDILSMFQYTIQEKNITVHNNIGQTITACVNEGHLKLVLRNLFSNAIKFSHAGGNVFFDAVSQDGKTKISVTDEGTGIPPSVFEALQNEQLNFTSHPGTAKEKGTGLGLMLVREFLLKNNGTLTIKSEQGKGSMFSIILPAGEPL